MTRLEELEEKMQHSHKVAVEENVEEEKGSWYQLAYINPEDPEAFKDIAEVEEYKQLCREALTFDF